MVKGGYSSPHNWNHQVERQYTLARSASAETAKTILGAEFGVILDGPSEGGPDLERVAPAIPPYFRSIGASSRSGPTPEYAGQSKSRC